MTRPAVAVRDANPDDLPDLLRLWAELREVDHRHDRSTPAPSEAAVLGCLQQAAQDPALRIVVAVLGAEVVGLAVLAHSAAAPLFEPRSVQVHHLYVREAHRRRGAGHALLACAAAFAEELGAEQVLTDVHPQQRDAQRFFARLGFGPLVVRRVTSVGALRRRLVADTGLGIASGLLARRRRSLRSRGDLPRV